MKKTLLFLLAAGLCGCSAVPSPGPVVEVKIPVVVPCVAVVPVAPVWAVDAVQDKADIWANTLALIATHEQHIGYEAVLIAALKGCIGVADQ